MGKIDNGTVLDVPNCELEDHAKDVSFNSILKKCNPTEPALLLLGRSSARLTRVPPIPHRTGEGLRWIAGGFGTLGLSDRKF